MQTPPLLGGGVLHQAASSSLVVLIGGLKRDSAHRNASAQRYKGREPKR
jgi:hypothetical protein